MKKEGLIRETLVSFIPLEVFIMSHDIVADALNMMRNARKAGKTSVKVGIMSNLLIEVLKIMKQEGVVKRYKINGKDKSLEITLGEFFECRAIKPRFSVTKSEIEKYRKRYLPSRNFGLVVISTSKGLMTHKEALEKNIGGSLIAYFY